MDNSDNGRDGEREVVDIEELELGEEQDDSQAEDRDTDQESRRAEEEARKASMARLTYIQDLERRLKASQDTLAEYVSAYKSLEEDKERFKQRIEREKAKDLEILRGKLVDDLLELMDNLDRSVMGAESSRNYDALSQGIKMVQHQFQEKLTRLGVETVPTVGHAFDPNLHEALDVGLVNDEAADGDVILEYSRGFRLKERVIRPAKVRVGRYNG